MYKIKLRRIGLKVNEELSKMNINYDEINILYGLGYCQIIQYKANEIVIKEIELLLKEMIEYDTKVSTIKKLRRYLDSWLDNLHQTIKRTWAKGQLKEDIPKQLMFKENIIDMVNYYLDISKKNRSNKINEYILDLLKIIVGGIIGGIIGFGLADFVNK